MPPASPPGSHGQPTEHTLQHPRRPDDRARRAPDRAAKVRFRRAVTLMLMTLVLPGSAQLVAGDRRVGRIALRTWLVLCSRSASCASWSGYFWHGVAFWAGTNTMLLGACAWA